MFINLTLYCYNPLCLYVKITRKCEKLLQYKRPLENIRKIQKKLNIQYLRIKKLFSTLQNGIRDFLIVCHVVSEHICAIAIFPLLSFILKTIDIVKVSIIVRCRYNLVFKLFEFYSLERT